MIELRKTEDRDFYFIAACLQNCDESFANQCGYGSRYFTFPVTEQQIRLFRHERKHISEFFTVTENGTPVGSLELLLHPDEKRGSVARFLIDSQYRGRGIGTEALRLLSEYAFNTLAYDTLTLTVFDFNRSARACYEKAGFTETGREIRRNGWTAVNMTKTGKE